LTRLYDPFLRVILKGEKFKTLLIEQAQITPGQRVLDLGCGTATLTIMVKRRCPDATVVGLDADAAALALARGKVAAAGVDVELHHGLASSAPFEPASFDRIVSSLLFHHLKTEHKRLTLKKARELLRPGESFTSPTGGSRRTRSCGWRTSWFSCSTASARLRTTCEVYSSR